MAEYLVNTADERGHVSEYVEHGASVAEVRDRFAQQGLLVTSIKPRGILGTTRSGPQKKLKLEQFVIFNQQFLTLIHAGLPILQGLDLLSKRQKNRYLRSVLENVRQRVRTGELLSEAFRHAAPGAVSKVYTTTLLAGEKSGNLEEVLGRFIAFQRVALAFRKKLLASLVYPALLVTMVMVMFTFLLSYVVPQFQGLYSQLGNGTASLPSITLFVLGIGEVVKHWLWAIVLGLAGAVFFLWRWSKTEGGSITIDRVRLALPLAGGIWLKYQVAIFSRTLSTLLSGGLPLVQALETAGSSIESKLLSNAVLQSVQKVREGLPLSRSLEETKLFPELAFQMIEVGESTGALPAMLTSIAEFLEEDVQTALSAALALIEPVILIVMGFVVATVLIALYLPIFSLGAQVGG
ncbi:MAG TPA: type II secretion system F family protein [Terriglobales bacterium]|jgi:type IV pilus assembly protein PilC|nr:type II secretion system F family protein [Terriglobales bacterium]